LWGDRANNPPVRVAMSSYSPKSSLVPEGTGWLTDQFLHPGGLYIFFLLLIFNKITFYFIHPGGGGFYISFISSYRKVHWEYYIIIYNQKFWLIVRFLRHILGLDYIYNIIFTFIQIVRFLNHILGLEQIYNIFSTY